MRRTDIDIRRRITDLMRLAVVLMLSAWTMLAVVSCGSSGGDDPDSPTPNKPDTPIAFFAFQQDEQTITRAAGLEDEGITTFTVYGYKNMEYYDGSGTYGGLQNVFPGYRVTWKANTANTTTSNSNDWEYVNQQASGEEQTIKYWDWSAKAYRFFGHTGGTAGGNDTTGPKILSFTADATNTDAAPYFSTLWFSTGNLSYYSDRQFGQPVKLVFTKPFVKVRFKFISADPDNVPLDQMTLTNISFMPKAASSVPKPADAVIETAGTVTVSYPLTGTEIRESFSVSGVTSSFTELKEYDRWYTLLPAKNQGVYILSVTVNGDERHISLPAEYMDWLPGYEYTYVFKLFEEGGVAFGQVYTAFTDWQTGTEKDYTIYNW